MFMDVFSILFGNLFDLLHTHTVNALDLMIVVQEELLQVRDRLAAHGYPNFSSGTKLRLVVDEAQVLSDKGSTKFQSSYLEIDPRPMLSPILNGFRTTGGREELTIIYCGTGLSMRNIHSALSSGAGAGIKEPRSETFFLFDFPGWTDRNSIQSYIDRVKEHLLDSESKNMVDTLIPPEAVDMLHRRFTGRFRPIVTAIEGIISSGDATKWESEINDAETMLTSWKDRERRNNLCGEILRLENKIAQHLEQFTSCLSIREALGLFLFRHRLLDAAEIILEDEAQLVEAAFGRIKIFGAAARIVLDEPFVLKAIYNYLRVKDPLLVSAAEGAMLHSDNPSVHGRMWEAMMPSVFVETFKNQPISSWPLLTKDALPEMLTGHVTIVGYNEQEPKLAISHKDITTLDFMKAHVKDNSKRGDQDIPPFYFPVPQVPRPNIIFFVLINNKRYPCFIQLKLRQVLETTDAEQALATVSGRSVQEKLNEEQKKHEKEQKEQQKQQMKQNQQEITCTESEKSEPPRPQDYCPTGVYISMVITCPGEVAGFQIVRPDPQPELTGLIRVSIEVDDNNFAYIFPEHHVNFLNQLKKLKRGAEDEQGPDRSKKTKGDI
ncbi:hypothetical protein BGZ54_007115 [Gamsiella multidivaricata]|nr:hypothetical protein BGZ54_007115 [Gamsiella multidivaricata]